MIKTFTKITMCSIYFLLAVFLYSCGAKFPDFQVQSPDGNTVVTLHLKEGNLTYTVRHGEQLVLEESQLGLILEGMDFSTGLEIVDISASQSVNDEYNLIHGKQKAHQYKAHERVFTIANGDQKKMEIIFRMSDNGVAFKYRFSNWEGEPLKISDEYTSYQFPSSARAWIQPMSDPKTGWERTNPSYEEEYSMNIAVGTPSPIASGWVYPALFKVNDTWMLISETGVKADMAASRLAAESNGGNYQIAFPSEQERIFDGSVRPSVKSGWESPWRILAVGSLKDIVESTLGTDLAEPQAIQNTDFIIPGAASWSWALGKDDSIIEEIQRSYIDYASKMNWEYCLIDVNWDVNIGYDGIQKLVNYASERGVGLWLWYNSAGDWNTAPYTPRDALLTSADRKKEFNRISEMGIKGVKIDFFGGDGQRVMEYYHDIFADAAEAGLMVNVHGSTLPRGWHRTYPNLMTAEAVKGFEMISFFQDFADRAPRHKTILPFTRNVYDPMDFTPMVLDTIPDINRSTSNTFELALSVLFYSGVQHFAESPEGMQKQPREVIQFLQDLPSSWDETRFIDGYPGEFVVLARRSGLDWYVAGVNGSDEQMQLTLDLTSIVKSGQSAGMISDGTDKNSYNFNNLNISPSIEIDLGSHKGFIIHTNSNE